jgi:hypothetical protein
MARSITLTLGAALGADLGPNFNLTADVGSVTPSTATKTELTSGKSVSVDDAATQVTVTSTGTCTNSITQTIPCAGGTTTTTSTTTTTTTAAPTTTSTSTTTAAPLTQVNINLCAGGADGSGYVDVFAYSSIAVDTQISVPFRWTGDLSSVFEGAVLINSGQTCGTVNVLAGQIGENFSNLEFLGDISPMTSLNQEYVPQFAGSGSPCTSC